MYVIKPTNLYTLARDAIRDSVSITYNAQAQITYQASFVGLDKKLSNPIGLLNFLEAPPGIGPGIRVLQTRALPLGHGALFSSEGEGNLPRSVCFKQGRDLCSLHLFEEKRARNIVPVNGADYGARTRHLHLGKVALYQMS